MTFAKANPAGWALFELLTSAQMNTIDDNLSFALDGRDGGSYAPSAGFLLDGGDCGTDPVITLLGALDVDTYALSIRLVNGSSRAIHVENLVSADETMVLIEGNNLASAVMFPAVLVQGNESTAGNVAAAMHVFGGNTSFITGSAGPALIGYGGSGSNDDTTGGSGLEGYGGASDFSASAAFLSGAPGVRGEGGDIVGTDITHLAGFGFLGFGGDATSDGYGGHGLYGFGGLGPSLSSTGVDRGIGVVGRGRAGLRGANNGADPLYMPVEFEDYLYRPGVHAVGKGHGLALLSQFSGASTDSIANVFEHVGAFQSGLNTIHRIRAKFTSGVPGGGDVVYGLTIGNESSVTHKFSNTIFGGGAPALGLDTTSSLGVSAPALTLGRNVLYTSEYASQQGAVGFLRSGQLTGLTDDAMFVGSGLTRQIYDRVVTSGDRCVPVAWARAVPNGVGGVTMSANYGMASVAVTNFFGINGLLFTMDTITGGTTLANMIAFGSMNALGYAASVVIDNDTQLWLVAQDIASGAYVNLATATAEIGILVHGVVTAGTPADRATFYNP